MKARQLILHHRTKKKIKKNILKASRKGDLRLKRRLQSVILCADGYTSGEIAYELGVSQQMVSLWLKTYSESGIEGLYSKPRSGRPKKLSDAQSLQLCDIIDSGPVAYGLPTGVWTSPLIRDVILEEFGIRYHAAHVRKLLNKFGFSVQRPRHPLVNADVEKRASWIRNTHPNIKKKPTKRKRRSP